MPTLKDFLILTKFNLSLTVSLSLLFAFVLAKNSLDSHLINPFLATLLLALGVSALNQVQEHKEDALMIRTKNRPVAAQRISVKQGYIISAILIVLFYIFIFFSLNFLGLAIFTAVIIIYNLLYTKAKKLTIYAAVYGAVLGVIPPLIGWLSAGGVVNHINFIALGIFYFIWQIPHFWLLTLKYHKDYEKANFPTIAKAFGIEVLERITFIWLLLTLIAGIFLVLLFVKNMVLVTIFVLLHAYVLYTIIQLRLTHNYLRTFISINSYMLLLMILLMINALFLSS